MRALLLALALLPASGWADEPFVTKPSRKAAVLIYGAAVAADVGSTFYATSRGSWVSDGRLWWVGELHPALQEPALMVAFKVAQGVVLVWLDGRLRGFWRWVLRGGAVLGYGWLARSNFRAGQEAGKLSRR